MKYTVDKTEQYTLVQIHAEKIDALKTPQLKSDLTAMSAEGAKSLILDFTDVKYVDSSGLSAILLAKRLCENTSGLLVIFGLNSTVKKVITIAQLDKVLTILPSKEEAIDAVFLHAIESDLKEGEN